MTNQTRTIRLKDIDSNLNTDAQALQSEQSQQSEQHSQSRPTSVEIDSREQFIIANPKNIPHELQLILVDIQTEFAMRLLSPKRTLTNNEANNLWSIVREIFREYGLE